MDEHVALRRYPRRVITFQPQDYDPSSPGNVPRFGVDYDLGDVVRARRTVGAVVRRLHAHLRLDGRPTAEGLETGDLLLIDDGAAGTGMTLETD